MNNTTNRWEKERLIPVFALVILSFSILGGLMSGVELSMHLNEVRDPKFAVILKKIRYGSPELHLLLSIMKCSLAILGMGAAIRLLGYKEQGRKTIVWVA